jgi:glucose/arabinose dehydrogenase/PKD repeat protein
MGQGGARLRAAQALALALLVAVGALPLGAAPASAAAGGPTTPYILGLDFPVSFVFSPDGRLFFNEKYNGTVRVVDVSGATPVLLPTPFATVANLNITAEMGLIGIALDPAFATTPWLYIYHTFDNGTVLENRITRYWAANNTSGPSEDIVTGIPAWDFHNGGILRFGPDGKLWVTTGDSHNGALAANISYLGGKVLRFNKDGTIPADNPFPGSPVYTRGHRNVFGLTFEPRTGTPVITENGELTNDEVNVLKPGADYGWPWDEGFANNSTKENPIWAISPTIAPTGIIADTSRHTGDNLTDLIFGDWNTASLRRLVVGPPGYDKVQSEELVFTRAVSHVLDLHFGPGGLLYLSTPEGIYTTDLKVFGNEPPVPVFWENRSYQFEGASVSFDGGASYDPEGGGIYSHKWTFGDGTNDTGSFIRHTFAAAGNYTVTLTVTDEIGAANSTSQVYHVLRRADNQPPVASIFVSRPIQFENRPIGFGAANSTDPEDGGIYAREWRFGDGGNASGSYVTHNFTARGTYIVSLTVADEFGATGTSSVTVQILAPSENTAPTAAAGGSTRGWAGIPMNFTAEPSSDHEGGIVDHLWDFGDGSTSALGVVAHTYAAPGAYAVSLTVWDELGASASTSLAVTVLDPATNQGPIAVITLPPGVLKATVNLTFSGEQSTDAEGGIYLHAWSFGDGTTAEGAYVGHTYLEPGEYTVRLTVFDELGATGGQAVTVTVRPFVIPPSVTFVASNWHTTLGTPIYFDGSASRDEDGYITDAYWDFGDGTNESGLQVTHYFRTPGNHTVTLYVVDEVGAVGNASSFAVVEPRDQGPPDLGAPLMAGAVTLAVVAAMAYEGLRERRR